MKTRTGLVAMLERQDGYFEIGMVAGARKGQITSFLTIHGRTVAISAMRAKSVMVEDAEKPYFTKSRDRLFKDLTKRYGGGSFKTRAEAQDFLRSYAQSEGAQFCPKCGVVLDKGEKCKRPRCAQEVAA